MLVELSELALHQLGARAFHVQLVSPPVAAGVPVRSTGTSLAVAGLHPVIQALAATGMVVDCTVEGTLHAAELPRFLAGGTRLMMISNEHPEVLERTKPTLELRERVRRGMQMLGSAKHMRVTSAAGTDLDVRIDGAPARGAPGFVDEPGKVGYWPAGLCLCFPRPGSVNGTELRAFAGNFLYSTGANESAKRFTACHFDYPLRDCSVELDGTKVVDRGRLSAELA